MRLFGFDSFAGLPQTAALDKVWSPTQFRIDIDFTRQRLLERGVDIESITLIEGFFEDTLGDDCIRANQLKKSSIIMIDSDLYTSAKEALEFVKSLIKDVAIVFFDDWNSTNEERGEKRALREFLVNNIDFAVEEFGSYAENAQVFIFRHS